jgi:hypothetical protein
MEETTGTNELFSGLTSFLKDSNLMNQEVFEEVISKEAATKVVAEEPKTEEKTETIGFTLEELEEAEKVETTKIIEKEETEEEPEKTPTEGSEEDNVYSVISQMLREDGILDSEFKSSEEMLSAFGEAIKNGIESYKDELPEPVKKLIEGYEEGVPFEDILKIKSEQIRLDSLTDENLEENVELQKALNREYFKATTKFSDVKIEKEIQRLADLDELFDSSVEAKEALKELNKEKEAEKIEEARQNRIRQEENYRKEINQLNERVSKTTEIIPGIKISEKEQKELFKAITTPVETRGSELLNQVMLVREKDPIGFEMKLNYYIKLGLFNETPDISKLTKVAETKTVSKLEKQLEDTARKNIAKSSGSSRQTSDDSDILKAASGIFKR